MTGNVPSDPKDERVRGKYQCLIVWVSAQRREIEAFDKDPSQEGIFINAERKQRLLDLGFKLKRETGQKKFDRAFWNRIEKLKAYKAEHGE